jgi:hypothetical protein
MAPGWQRGCRPHADGNGRPLPPAPRRGAAPRRAAAAGAKARGGAAAAGDAGGSRRPRRAGGDATVAMARCSMTRCNECGGAGLVRVGSGICAARDGPTRPSHRRVRLPRCRVIGPPGQLRARAEPSVSGIATVPCHRPAGPASRPPPRRGLPGLFPGRRHCHYRLAVLHGAGRPRPGRVTPAVSESAVFAGQLTLPPAR